MTIRRSILIILSLFVIFVWYAGYVACNQGISQDFWTQYDIAKVSHDEDHIPLIEGSSWEKIIEAQGFVTASERFFQMDLTRRFSAGRLSEVFGKKLTNFDFKRRQQNWEKIAQESYADLSSLEQRICDAYARGVNAFLEQHENRVGIEYVLLRHHPEPWHCKDSLLVLMSMAQRLASSGEADLSADIWSEFLPDSWVKFLFSTNHPWNIPLFGRAHPDQMWPEAIPQRPLKEDQEIEDISADIKFYGSNSWVVVENERRYLANDPHLGHSVPQIWFPVRLFKEKKDWVVGVSIPGIPGVVIGINPHFAWGMTNVGEDVEDYVVEEVDLTEKKYVASIDNGHKKWLPLMEESFVVNIKGEDPVHGTAYFTHRGPLEENPLRPGQYLSKQWLPLKSGMLRIPTIFLNRATNWNEFNQAIDGFTIPAQNLVFLDKEGNMGYRASGRTIQKKVLGKRFPDFTQGEWQGIDGASTRYRKFIPFKKNHRQILSVANQRIWTDDYYHDWAPDDRADRIQQQLESMDEINMPSMKALQVDTYSRFHLLVRDFLLKYDPDSLQKMGLFAEWSKWSGVAEEDKATFTQLDYVRRLFENTLLQRVRDTYAEQDQNIPAYRHYVKRAWMVRVLEHPEQLSVFGLQPQDMARWLLNRLQLKMDSGLQLYDEANRWTAQHPFVDSVPVLGHFFKVSEFNQTGFSNVVKVEMPDFGASFRVVFDLKNPEVSGWSFPVGLSGHFHSKFFANFRAKYKKHEFIPVFPKELHERFFHN